MRRARRAVAVLFAELQPSAAPEVLGHLAIAAGGGGLVELLDTESGETLYNDAQTARDEAQLQLCLTGLLARMLP